MLAPAVTSRETDAAYVRLLLADGRLPTGAHTQSAGLEPAFRHGMRLAEVPVYLQVRLETVTEVEAASAVVARATWLRSSVADRPGALATVDAAWRARTPSDAIRDAADLLGRGYRRLAETLWDLGLDPAATPCRAVVLGATAAASGLGAADTARLVGFDEVQTVIAAALKLEPFDPALGVRWSADAGRHVEAMVARVENAQVVDDIPARSAPLVEQWAHDHQHSERRLYRA